MEKNEIDINAYVILDSFKIYAKSFLPKDILVKTKIVNDPDKEKNKIFELYSNDPIFAPIIAKLQNPKSSVCEKVKKKITEILMSLISYKNIDYKIIRKLTFVGIPDEFPGLRSIIWKLMLGYLPNSPSEWHEYLLGKRADYENLKVDFLLEVPDEKLSYILTEIVKDVKRTRSHMHFFTSATKILNDNETNADVLTRILFIFAKFHPDIAYVQGMNEIIAPIYYCFCMDQNEFFNTNLEADVFYCFESFMLEIKEIFLREKDDTESGIHSKINKIDYLLELYDINLYKHFKKHKVEIHYFAFRWFTLFFTQEFNMPDTLRLWDSLLVHHEKFEFISHLCLSLITMQRKSLLKTDFAGMMQILQNISQLEINMDIWIANSIEITYKLSSVI